jgi:Ribosomal protein HS6-type (S12/L30/L7a)
VKNKVYGLLGLCSKAGKVIVGTDVCVENIKNKKVKLIILANDTSEKSKEKIKFLCVENEVEVIEYGDIEQLSRSVGKINKAVIGIKDKNFAIEIKKLVDGGEI